MSPFLPFFSSFPPEEHGRCSANEWESVGVDARRRENVKAPMLRDFVSLCDLYTEAIVHGGVMYMCEAAWFGA